MRSTWALPSSERSAKQDMIAVIAAVRHPIFLCSCAGLWTLTLLSWSLAGHIGTWNDRSALWCASYEAILSAAQCASGMLVGYLLAGYERRAVPPYVLAAAALLALSWVSRVAVEWVVGAPHGTLREWARILPLEFTRLAVFAALGRLAMQLLRRQQARSAIAAMGARVEEARAQALHARLQPEFVDDCLKTISDRIAQDPADADRLLIDLSELLRLTLTRLRSEWVPLATELAFVSAYFRLACGVRSSPGRITVTCEPGSAHALVPSGCAATLFEMLQSQQPGDPFQHRMELSASVKAGHVQLGLSYAHSAAPARAHSAPRPHTVGCESAPAHQVPGKIARGAGTVMVRVPRGCDGSTAGMPLALPCL